MRVRTYVDLWGDPGFYIMIGRKLLSLPVGSEEWRFWVTQMNPLHPLMLGVVACWWSPFAAYELPFLLGMGWLWITRYWIRRWTEDAMLADCAVVGIPIVLFMSSPYHASYLMYPYREVTSLFWCSVGLALFAPAFHEGSAKKMFSSGLTLLLGAAGREVAVVLFLGPLLMITSDIARTWTERARLSGALLCPLLVAVVGWLLVPTIRFHQVNYYLERNLAEAAPRDWWENFAGYLRWMWRAFGPVGLLLITASVVASRSCRGWGLFLIMIPAIAMLTLYSWVLCHPRYAMHAKAWVAPLFGVGLVTCARWAIRFFPRFPRGVAEWGAWAGLLLWALVVASRQTTEVKFSKSDVREAISVLSRFARAGDLFYTEPRCRAIPGLLTAYSPYHTFLGTCQSPHTPPTEAWKLNARTFYVRPLDDAALIRASVMDHGIRIVEWLNYFGDLVIPGGGSAPEVFEFGPYRFALEEVRPFSVRRVRNPIGCPPSNGVLWLDLRSAEASGEVGAWLENESSQRLYTWPLFGGNGLVPLAWPRDLPVASAWIVVTSSVPIPSQVVVADSQDTPGAFRCDHERRVSLSSWFEPPFMLGTPGEKYVAALTRGGRIRIPAPVGIDEAPWGARVTLRLSAPPRARGRARLQVVSGGDRYVKVIRLENNPHDLEFDVSSDAGGSATADIEMDSSGCTDAVLRVVSIRIEYR